MKRIESFLILVCLASTVYAQKDASLAQVARPGGSMSFADGRGNLAQTEHLACGAASPLGQTAAGSGPAGPMTIDLSFGILPAGDRLGDAESVIGSWSVRSVAGPLFDGGVTRGTIAPRKAGVMVYELYGFTNFTGSSCNGGGRGAPGADYDTRNPVRIYGACGNDQAITFEISRRPLVSGKLGPQFEDRDVVATAVFRGNVACGQTSDRGRVRINLTSRR